MKNQAVVITTLTVLTISFLCSSAIAQKNIGFKMPPGKQQVEIDFEQHNNLIIIPITVNNLLTLKFILDTGVQAAVLTEKLYAEILNINYAREIMVAGPGIADSVGAYVANGVTFNLGALSGNNMNMLVLQEDYLKLPESIGDEVQGLIGYDIFSRFSVSINYDYKTITFTEPTKCKKNKFGTRVPLEIRGSKPFLKTTVKQGNTKMELDMMVDTGASHAALIDYFYLNELETPGKTITAVLGRGIAGAIKGHLGRLDLIEIDRFDFKDVLISMPFEGIYNKSIKRGARFGTIGGELLSRFNVTFCYQQNSMFLTKSRKYKEPFEYNMSGMLLNAAGSSLDTLKVVSITKESPAFQAGIGEGDVIHSINGKNLKNSKLSYIYQLLQSKESKWIRCKVIQDGKMRKVKFMLKRAI